MDLQTVASVIAIFVGVLGATATVVVVGNYRRQRDLLDLQQRQVEALTTEVGRLRDEVGGLRSAWLAGLADALVELVDRRLS